MWEVAVHLAVACGVCHGVFLCCPTGCLGWILNLIESVYESFPSYSSSVGAFRIGQEPTALAVGVDGGCLDIFLSSIISFLPLSGRRPNVD